METGFIVFSKKKKTSVLTSIKREFTTNLYKFFNFKWKLYLFFLEKTRKIL